MLARLYRSVRFKNRKSIVLSLLSVSKTLVYRGMFMETGSTGTVLS